MRILNFTARFLGWLVVLYVVSCFFLDFPAISARARICAATADATAAVLRVSGMPCAVRGAHVYPATSPPFYIVLGCTGFLSALLLTAAIAAYPATYLQKLAGIAVSIPIIFVANLVRLFAAAWIGHWNPRLSDLLHDYVFGFLYVALVVGSWIVWEHLIRTPSRCENTVEVGLPGVREERL